MSYAEWMLEMLKLIALWLGGAVLVFAAGALVIGVVYQLVVWIGCRFLGLGELPSYIRGPYK